jgi:hypothetical protein
MQRVFVENVGRYKRGMLRDWPLATWRGIRNWQRATVPLEGLLDQVKDQEQVRLPDGSIMLKVGQELDLDEIDQEPRRGPGRPRKYPRE